MNPMKPTPIRRWQYVLGYFVLVVAFVYVVAKQEQQANKLEAVVASNQAVLCDLKAYAAAQLAATKAFIKAHPQGIVGLTREELLASRERQKLFAESFDDAQC